MAFERRATARRGFGKTAEAEPGEAGRDETHPPLAEMLPPEAEGEAALRPGVAMLVVESAV